MAIGDLDGDLDNDLAVANQFSDDISLLMNNGDGTFAMHVTYEVGDGPTSVVMGDFDGDLDLDLAVSIENNDIVLVLLNNGDGTFAAGVPYGTGDRPFSVALGDLDGDLDFDLVATNRDSDNISVLLNNGNGTFATHVTYSVGNEPHLAAIGDLDGDLDLDVATANALDNNISVLLNNGNGTFEPQHTYDVGVEPRSVAMGDLDGDLDLDVAVVNAAGADISVLLNDGNGSFTLSVNYDVGSRPFSVEMGDLDSDSDLDLAVTNSQSDNVSIFLNNGDGTFPPAAPYGVGDTPRNLAMGDLDGDGDLDLAIANRGSDDVSVLLNEPCDPPIVNPVLWEGNGHAYAFILADGIEWSGAQYAASTFVFQGISGYLATVTSQEENDFIAAMVQQAKTDHNLNILIEVWLGAEQLDPNAPPADTWAWVTGEAFQYTNWDIDEPNDGGGDEHFLGMWGPDGDGPMGQWNDQGDSFVAANIEGYVVEFEVPQSLVVVPDSLLVTRGSQVSGGLVDLADSDNIDLSIQRASSDTQSRTEFEVEAVSPVENPTSLEVTLEGAVFARSQVNQSIELFNYLAFPSGAWEPMDTRVATPFTDSTVTLSATGDLSRFVQPITMRTRARIRYQSTSPRQQFSSNTDQFIWTIGQ